MNENTQQNPAPATDKNVNSEYDQPDVTDYIQAVGGPAADLALTEQNLVTPSVSAMDGKNPSQLRPNAPIITPIPTDNNMPDNLEYSVTNTNNKHPSPDQKDQADYSIGPQGSLKIDSKLAKNITLPTTLQPSLKSPENKSMTMTQVDKISHEEGKVGNETQILARLQQKEGQRQSTMLHTGNNEEMKDYDDNYEESGLEIIQRHLASESSVRSQRGNRNIDFQNKNMISNTQPIILSKNISRQDMTETIVSNNVSNINSQDLMNVPLNNQVASQVYANSIESEDRQLDNDPFEEDKILEQNDISNGGSNQHSHRRQSNDQNDIQNNQTSKDKPVLNGMQKILELQQIQKDKLKQIMENDKPNQQQLEEQSAAPAAMNQDNSQSDQRIEVKSKKRGFFMPNTMKNQKVIDTTTPEGKFMGNPSQSIHYQSFESPSQYMQNNMEDKNMQEWPPAPREVATKTVNQYVDITVYTQSAEDCQWGIFDFENVKIDPSTGKIVDEDSEEDSASRRNRRPNYETCKFQIKGTNYITRQSKYKMGQCLPTETSEGQISMGSLSILQHPETYEIYQNEDVALDFTQQVKLQDDFISKQLKDLSTKSYMVTSGSNKIGTFKELKGMNKKVKVTKTGAVIRTGDIIKFGRVPIMIKESSIDIKKWEKVQQLNLHMNTLKLNGQIGLSDEDPDSKIFQNNNFGGDSLMDNSMGQMDSGAHGLGRASQGARVNQSQNDSQMYNSGVNLLSRREGGHRPHNTSLNLITGVDNETQSNLNNMYAQMNQSGINASQISLDAGPNLQSNRNIHNQQNRSTSSQNPRDNIMFLSNASPSLNNFLDNNAGQQHGRSSIEQQSDQTNRLVNNSSAPAHGHPINNSLNSQRLFRSTSGGNYGPGDARSFHSQQKRGGRMLQGNLAIIKEELRLNTNQMRTPEAITKVKKEKKKNKEVQKKNCRICLCEESEEKDDPIISPCLCKGFSGYIHLMCLREWLNSKRKINKLSSFQDNYIYKKSQCEVCNTLFPDMVEIKGKQYAIFDFEKPKKQNYIIFEVLGMPVGKNFSVVRIPDDYQIEIGRSHAEMCVPDVSVSKKQATLKYDLSVGELVISDTNSKYGTHVLIQRPIRLKVNRPIYALNGLSLIKLELKQENTIFSHICGCFKSNKDKYDEDKYNQETQLLYNSVKDYLPQDLIKYQEEAKLMPESVAIDEANKFKDNSVHLIPNSQRNAFYVKQQGIDDDQSSMNNSEICASEQLGPMQTAGLVSSQIKDLDAGNIAHKIDTGSLSCQIEAKETDLNNNPFEEAKRSQITIPHNIENEKTDEAQPAFTTQMSRMIVGKDPKKIANLPPTKGKVMKDHMIPREGGQRAIRQNQKNAMNEKQIDKGEFAHYNPFQAQNQQIQEQRKPNRTHNEGMEADDNGGRQRNNVVNALDTVSPYEAQVQQRNFNQIQVNSGGGDSKGTSSAQINPIDLQSYSNYNPYLDNKNSHLCASGQNDQSRNQMNLESMAAADSTYTIVQQFEAGQKQEQEQRQQLDQNKDPESEAKVNGNDSQTKKAVKTDADHYGLKAIPKVFQIPPKSRANSRNETIECARQEGDQYADEPYQYCDQNIEGKLTVEDKRAPAMRADNFQGSPGSDYAAEGLPQQIKKKYTTMDESRPNTTIDKEEKYILELDKIANDIHQEDEIDKQIQNLRADKDMTPFREPQQRPLDDEGQGTQLGGQSSSDKESINSNESSGQEGSDLHVGDRQECIVESSNESPQELNHQPNLPELMQQ